MNPTKACRVDLGDFEYSVLKIESVVWYSAPKIQTLLILSPLVAVLPAYAVGFKELGGHGVVQLPDHGYGALAGIGNLLAAAQELERGC